LPRLSFRKWNRFWNRADRSRGQWEWGAAIRLAQVAPRLGPPEFPNRLIIVVRHDDAPKFSLNLFRVREYRAQILHASWMSLALSRKGRCGL